MSTAFSIDLDAARRERQAPDGIPVILKGEEFILPGELPTDVFDPFLTDEFDLGGLLVEVAKMDDAEPLEVLVKLLFNRPKLPVETLNAVFAALELLFGAEQWAEFRKLRPSIKDQVALVKGAFKLYGTSVGEAFASAAKSASGGPTSKPTSPGSTTDSTPETSGDDQAPEADSSESAG